MILDPAILMIDIMLPKHSKKTLPKVHVIINEIDLTQMPGIGLFPVHRLVKNKLINRHSDQRTLLQPHQINVNFSIIIVGRGTWDLNIY